MDLISLKVTSKVIQQTAKTKNQEQISIEDAPANIQDLCRNTNKDKQFKIIVGSALTLNVGDSHAIWKSHNLDSEHFQDLYALLSKYPDKPFFLAVEVVNGL